MSILSLGNSKISQLELSWKELSLCIHIDINMLLFPYLAQIFKILAFLY